ncbi:MAG: MMPL family transporter [Bacteroidales bacterium]|nr:MMPL family transporter [Bacteroidales bacterium]
MWKYIVRFILRNRIANLIVISLITAFMAYNALNARLSYQLVQMLPDSDSTIIEYKKFKDTFGADGSVLFVGVQTPEIFKLDLFNQWYDLTQDLTKIEGVQEIVSLSRLYRLERNDSLKKFDFKAIINNKPSTQKELDSLLAITFDQPLYDNLLYNRQKQSTLMMITLDREILNKKSRVQLIEAIEKDCDAFGGLNDLEIHYSGLPYIRTKTSLLVQKELLLFVILAMLITSIVLFLFFRSFKAVIVPMIIVLISVIWVMGTISLLGYEITVLTGILPPLLIIIGVENCIFLLNKFHHEYKSHRNKIKGLARIVQKVGNATFLTNLTTAVGFAAFIATGNRVLVEFGIIASINIMAVFFLSIFLVPIFYSFMKPPEEKHIKHLENKLTQVLIEKILYVVEYHRNTVYILSGISVIIAIIGISQLKTTGRVVDDIAQDSKLYQDIEYMQEQVNGILPLEISIDTHKPNGVLNTSFLRKIDRLQDTLATYSVLSKPLSIAEVAKTARQAFYRGNVNFYELPNNQEKNFILKYVPLGKAGGQKSIINSFVDSTMSKTRISVQMANIGTNEIQALKDDLRPKIDKIFNPEKYNVQITGSSVVFLKGTNYLIKNLVESLLLALLAISLLMALLFTSAKMIGISLIPNLMPQLLTAALMGFAAISIKPSTILIFSIALGISVDNAIHFLSRYRLELKHNNWRIKESVLAALRETSFSMIYSSTVLFLGFAIFTQSSFGGTEAMGYLVSFTLLIAVMSNLFILPSLLLTLDKRATTRSFKEPLLEIFDEEEDIELSDLEIETVEENQRI